MRTLMARISRKRKKKFDRKSVGMDGPGPWTIEDDRVEFDHAGMKCLITRGPLGAWCGYVAVGVAHPYYRLWYGACVEGCPHREWVPPEEAYKDDPTAPDHARQFLKTMRELAEKNPKGVIFDKEWHDMHPRCEEYGHAIQSKVDVHGGLTYSGENNPEVIGREDAPLQWWFGFDCGHSNDLVPGLIRDAEALSEKLEGRAARVLSHIRDGVYRTQEYVMAETKRLAEQLARIKDGE
jgi:hypothetical protein